jgi:hypothetical protein
MTVSASALTGVFVTVDPASGKTGIGDSFTLNFKSNAITAGASGSAKKAAIRSKATKSTPRKSAKKAASQSKAKSATGKAAASLQTVRRRGGRKPD